MIRELEDAAVLLSDPSEVPDIALPVGRPIRPGGPVPRARPNCDARSDPLVAVEGVSVYDAYAHLGLLPARSLKLRSGALDRLRQARALLPDGFDLVVLDAWRTPDEQRALLAHYSALGPTEGFVASLDPDAIRPPHTTGGAVDLTLGWKGQALALGTDFDSFSDAAHLHAFEHRDGQVRRLRRLLAAVLEDSGFAGYELEWWHWAYGDDIWAAAFERAAIYGIWEND